MQEQLTKSFAGLNATMGDRQMAWAKERKAALVALPETEAYIEAGNITENDKKYASKWNPASNFAYARKLQMRYDTAGGKGWFNIFDGRTWAMIEPLIEKNIAATIAKRDSKIIYALKAKGIDSLPDFELVHSSDGSEGTFCVGEHTVTIRTILAGGYNIQCLHQRTLVKVN